MKNIIARIGSWVKRKTSHIHIEKTIIINGKEVDPNSPEAIAAEKELKETLEELKREVSRIFHHGNFNM